VGVGVGGRADKASAVRARAVAHASYRPFLGPPPPPSQFADIFDAKTACEHLSGFNVGGRYLTVLYYQPQRTGAAVDVGKAQAEVEALRARVGANEAAAKAGAAAAAAATGGGGGGEDDDTALDEDEKDRKLVGRR
jgi:hypothetical protein